MLLAICSIRTDGGTQPRETINFVTVADYADDMRAGAIFPPIVVFNDGADYWLADGFHRIKAAEQAGYDEIEADVRQGTQQDAQWYSYSVNQSHGLRRTNEDKRRAVEAALQHPYANRYSLREIAVHCGVSHMTVQRYRDDNCNNVTDTRLVNRNGHTYTMDISGIRKKIEEDDLDDAERADLSMSEWDEPLSEYEQGVAERYATEYVPAPRMSQPMNVLTSEGTTEWYTPPDIIERARTLMGAIDLDPASSAVAQGWVGATAYHTTDTPSQQPWAGRVWLNPPFDDTPAWVDRLDSEYTDGDVSEAVLLVNSAPGYIWWEDLWRRRPVCMLRERLCFWTPEGKPGGQAKKGTTIAYYGTNVEKFKRVFGDIGRVILPED